MGDIAYKVYSSYLDDNSYFTLSKTSSLHVVCKSEGKLIYDDYVDVKLTHNEMDGYLGVSIFWDEYENTVGGLFSNRYYELKFYASAEKLHINGKNQYGATISIIVSLPPRLRI